MDVPIENIDIFSNGLALPAMSAFSFKVWVSNVFLGAAMEDRSGHKEDMKKKVSMGIKWTNRRPDYPPKLTKR